MIVDGRVCAIPQANIDTDQIIPAKYLSGITPEGLGKYLFEGMPDGRQRLAERGGATILVARDNLGCGSSREHAVWALRDWGFRAAIAPSFARIFLENCYTNGLVPVILEDPAALAQCEAADTLQIDVAKKTVSADGHQIATFKLDELRERFVLHGGFLDYCNNKIGDVRTWLAERERLEAVR